MSRRYSADSMAVVKFDGIADGRAQYRGRVVFDGDNVVPLVVQLPLAKTITKANVARELTSPAAYDIAARIMFDQAKAPVEFDANKAILVRRRR